MALGTRPISEVLQDIVDNVRDIIRAEVRLAKTEVGEELVKARSAGILCGAGAVMAIFGGIFLLLAIVYGLSLIIPEWAAFLIVGAAVGLAAILTLRLGMKRLQTIHAAPKTAASLKENVEWAKRLTR